MSYSFINNETQSNEILNIIKVASSIFFTSVFRDNTGFYPKYMIANFHICLRKFTKIHLAVEMIRGVRKPTFCICEKTQISYTVTGKLIGAFVFAT